MRASFPNPPLAHALYFCMPLSTAFTQVGWTTSDFFFIFSKWQPLARKLPVSRQSFGSQAASNYKVRHFYRPALCLVPLSPLLGLFARSDAMWNTQVSLAPRTQPSCDYNARDGASVGATALAALSGGTTPQRA